MSTILKTLKKLEEDKRLLDKDSDLKELVLQEDLQPFVGRTIEFSRNHFIALGLVLAGVIIGLALVWGFQPSIKNEVAHFSQGFPEHKPATSEKKASEPTLGIPLSNIPEQRRVRPKQRQVREEKIEEIFPPATEILVPPPISKTRESFTEPEAPAINEIRDLIQNAKIEANQPASFAFPAEPATRGVSIPHLKVKGIIFFSAGSASNHIFVATSEKNNQKIRVGDTIQSATLTHIDSNRVVFSYQGDNVHLRIGE
jgi:hypothetical protein